MSNKLNRRTFLQNSVAIGTLVSTGALASASVLGPQIALAQTRTSGGENSFKPERKKLSIHHNLDFSSIPLFIGRDMGFATAQGIELSLRKAKSAENTIKALKEGKIDAAVLPPETPLTDLFEQDGSSEEQLVTAFCMGLNSSALTIRPSLYHQMVEADRESMSAVRPTRSSALAKVISARKRNKMRPLRFGVTNRYGAHELMARYWLAEGGVDPDDGIEFFAMSGPVLVASLKAGAIDGFLAQDPWCSHAINKELGYAVISGGEIWSNAPAATLVVSLGWAQRNPNSHRALIRCLSEAGLWCDTLDNRSELIRRMMQKDTMNAPRKVLENSLNGTFTYISQIEAEPAPDFSTFHRYAANFPWRSDAVWYLAQLTRWGFFDTAFDMRRVALSVYRPDLYRAALSDTIAPVPKLDFRTEGSNFAPFIFEQAETPFVMGSDAFVDGRLFNPSSISDYLAGFEINNMTVDLSILSQLNG
ncbi:MAG: CmpA/NrtA family ABC transporter substrate-binding protein [Alphaproteobacteria bacterium]